jgi:ANTAR domain
VSLDGLRVADAMCRAATEVMQAQAAHDAVEAIVRTAVRTVPRVDRASISVHDREGGFETIAATDDLTRLADKARYGPRACGAAWSDPHHEPWPAQPPHNTVRTAMTVLLSTSRRTATALNLYCVEGSGLDGEARHVAHLFAAHARIGLRTARTAQDLRQALASRKEIGTAIGIVMERYALDEDRAFDYLVRVSRTNNVKLRQVAAGIVDATDRAHDHRGEPPARPGAGRPPGRGGASADPVSLLSSPSAPHGA